MRMIVGNSSWELTILYTLYELQDTLRITPTGILHVGAHLAEEAEMYEKLIGANLGQISWVESQADKCKAISGKLNPLRHVVINATIWDENDVSMSFRETNNSESSSLLEFSKHSNIYPSIKVVEIREVTTSRLDRVIDEGTFDFINIDLQGVELRALKSLGDWLHDLKWIYLEVNKEQLYKDCALVNEIDEYLSKFDFKRVSTRWVLGAGWGDAIYFKNNDIRLRIKIAAIQLGLKWQLITISRLVRSKLPKRLRTLINRVLRRSST